MATRTAATKTAATKTAATPKAAASKGIVTKSVAAKSVPITSVATSDPVMKPAALPKAKTAPAKSERRIVETAQEARGGEPGPSVLALLAVSTIAAGFVLAIVWFMFFRV